MEDKKNDVFEKLNLTFDGNEEAVKAAASKKTETSETTVVFDKMTFVNDDEKPIEPEKSSKKAKHKKKSKLNIFIWILSIILVSCLIAYGVLVAFVDVTGILGSSAQKEVEIPKGSSTEEIATILQEKELIKSKLLFRVFSKFTHSDGNYQYGTYYLNGAMGYEGMIDELQTIGTVAKQVKVTIPERANVDDIAKLLEKNKVCTASQFKTAMKSGKYDYDFMEGIPSESVYYLLEGYLYPDTYYFFISDGENGEENAQRAINKMLSHFDDQITDEMYAQVKKSGRSFHEIMTLASIVELEASAQAHDMPKVAQVFYNRLNKWEVPKLQSDPTQEYISDRYDTYAYEGLPPGPLCSPSLDAVKAAIYPDKSVTAFYFVTDKNMKFYYSDTLSQHTSIISSLKSSGMWAD